jgi:drug/metabolite transporter (DMT)-like permease
MLVQIAVLAWLFLGESPGLPALLGILLVSAGVYVVQVAGRSAPSGEDSRTAGSTGR